MSATRIRLPMSALVLGMLGLITAAVGIIAMTGQLTHVHPLLSGDAGLALLVSGIALILSGAFPFALAFLAASNDTTD